MKHTVAELKAILRTLKNAKDLDSETISELKALPRRPYDFTKSFPYWPYTEDGIKFPSSTTIWTDFENQMYKKYRNKGDVTMKTKNNISSCTTDLVGDEIRNKIREIGILWRNSEHNPKISNEIIDKWEQLIIDWKNDKSLPLIIRKSSDGYGQEYTHSVSGRILIITDNTFSQWVYFNIINNICYSLDEIKDMLRIDKIPFAMVPSKTAKHRTALGKYSVNNLGWKLCHIDEVGLKTNQMAKDLPMELLEEHFIKLSNPKNMFVLPKEIGYIGEIKEFIDEQR